MSISECTRTSRTARETRERAGRRERRDAPVRGEPCDRRGERGCGDDVLARRRAAAGGDRVGVDDADRRRAVDKVGADLLGRLDRRRARRRAVPLLGPARRRARARGQGEVGRARVEEDGEGLRRRANRDLTGPHCARERRVSERSSGRVGRGRRGRTGVLGVGQVERERPTLLTSGRVLHGLRVVDLVHPVLDRERVSSFLGEVGDEVAASHARTSCRQVAQG